MASADTPPDFRCPKGHSVGAHRNGAGSPWTPVACYVCASNKRRLDARKRRELGPVVAGIDLRKAVAFYSRQVPFIGMPRGLTLSIGHSTSGDVGGVANHDHNEVRLACGPDATPAHLLEVLVHEMCHIRAGERAAHGERFRLLLRRAAWEFWRIAVPLRPPLEEGDGLVAYAMDRLILAQLLRQQEAGALDLRPFAPAPHASKRARKARPPLVERRAAQARRRLARAEHDLRAVERRIVRWSAKVRYYDKVLARRGAR